MVMAIVSTNMVLLVHWLGLDVVGDATETGLSCDFCVLVVLVANVVPVDDGEMTVIER
jgi:hypothetical protein